MKVLGIETSCDETAAALVDGERRILSDIVRSQLAEHEPFGGVVPEIAARAHVEALDGIIRRALDDANCTLADIDAVAATGGPGLIGGVIVGVMTGKGIAAAANKPFVAVNHLEGHALTARLTDDLPFPYLLLLVSGGHCQLLIVEGVGQYARLGTTIDDAVGEAFDKTAKLLGLGYPGGPAVQAMAEGGDATAYDLPRPMKGRAGCDFSFSGLKTAVRQHVDRLPDGPIPRDVAADLAAAFQQAVAEAICDRAANAMEIAQNRHPGIGALVVAGGVAANTALRAALERTADAAGMRLVAPPPKLCTDNGAMIAWAGLERFRLGLTDDVDFAPRPRWPLDETAPPRPYAGVKA